MALKNLPGDIGEYVNLLPTVRHSPVGRLQASYDEEADVLYVHFSLQPRPATDSELMDDDIIVRYDGEEIIGITILHAASGEGAHRG